MITRNRLPFRPPTLGEWSAPRYRTTYRTGSRTGFGLGSLPGDFRNRTRVGECPPIPPMLSLALKGRASQSRDQAGSGLRSSAEVMPKGRGSEAIASLSRSQCLGSAHHANRAGKSLSAFLCCPGYKNCSKPTSGASQRLRGSRALISSVSSPAGRGPLSWPPCTTSHDRGSFSGLGQAAARQSPAKADFLPARLEITPAPQWGPENRRSSLAVKFPAFAGLHTKTHERTFEMIKLTDAERRMLAKWANRPKRKRRRNWFKRTNRAKAQVSLTVPKAEQHVETIPYLFRQRMFDLFTRRRPPTFAEVCKPFDRS